MHQTQEQSIDIPIDIYELFVKNFKPKALNGAFKIFQALKNLKKTKSNKSTGYFPVPSSLLQKICYRYKKIIDLLAEHEYLTFKKGKKISAVTGEPTKYYRHSDTVDSPGFCMQYKFCKITKLKTVKVKITNWFRFDPIIDDLKENLKVLHNELDLPYDEKPSVKRDNFSRRLHHSAIPYKKLLAGKGYSEIDQVQTQPSIIYWEMKKRNYNDPLFFYLIEEGDVYNHIMEELKLKDRDEAKVAFMQYLMGRGYVTNPKIRYLFPGLNRFIRQIKKGNYREMARFLQRKESKIWIDDILRNLPVKFKIPWHDSIVVKDSDVDECMEWIKEKHPQYRFKVKDIPAA